MVYFIHHVQKLQEAKKHINLCKIALCSFFLLIFNFDVIESLLCVCELSLCFELKDLITNLESMQGMEIFCVQL